MKGIVRRILGEDHEGPLRKCIEKMNQFPPET